MNNKNEQSFDENEIIAKTIKQRKGDYHIFESGVKEEMGKKLKALMVIQQYYITTGNAEKETYYFDLVERFKEKINNFKI